MKRSSVALSVVTAVALGGVLARLPEWLAERSESRRSPPETLAPPPAPSVPAPPADLAHAATAEELQLWNDRGCVTCHGSDGRGTEMGPDVIDVLPLYLAKHATRAAALQPLAAYIFDPKASPKLRSGEDGEYRSPMPGIVQIPGGTRDEAVVLAGLLLRLAK